MGKLQEFGHTAGVRVLPLDHMFVLAPASIESRTFALLLSNLKFVETCLGVITTHNKKE